jgi:N-acetylglucosaminyldiphosphoundecaprenol N-acetyl-beta-D-mannosaminyltransferase
VDAVDEWSRTSRQVIVAHHNVNSLALMQRDRTFARFYDQHVDASFVDGATVMLIARLLGAPVQHRHRIAVLDWIWLLFERAEQEQWSIVHVGGCGPVLSKAVDKIKTRHPRLQLTTVSGFFDMADPAQNAAVLDAVRGAHPTVVLVGMGMPRQETWLLENLDRLPDCVLITVGGILGYLGEDRATPPRWIGAIGLEWLFRLASEPRRLWRRYLVEPLPLIPALVAEVRRRRVADGGPSAYPGRS